MKIKQLQKTTFIDFPGRVACTIFLFGCNFKCGFCHNPELVVNEETEDISKEDILDFLEKRKNILDGVCFTGGEPLMSVEKDFLKKIKEKGYEIKLDTNGSFPEKLKEFIEEDLVDFVSMDIKGSREKYHEISNSEISLDKIEKSIKTIVNSGKEYEFRTTVLKSFHDEREIENLGRGIQETAGFKPKKYVLQGFKKSGKLIDESFNKEPDVYEEYLKKLKSPAEEYFEKVEIRG